MITVLKSKIRDIFVSAAVPNYEGSVTLSPRLLKEANIIPYEQVQILNANNGERIITYAIPSEDGKECCEINGPATRKFQKGDKVMILSYQITDAIETGFSKKPIVVSYEDWVLKLAKEIL